MRKWALFLPNNPDEVAPNYMGDAIKYRNGCSMHPFRQRN